MNKNVYAGNETRGKWNTHIIKCPFERGIVTNWDDMEKIWDYTFYKEFHVDPAEHPVLLTESPFNPKANREMTIQIMFETYNVPSYYVGNQAVLSLYSTGRTTGTVFDAGHAICNAVPIYEGYSIPHANKSFLHGEPDLIDWLEKILSRGDPINYNALGGYLHDFMKKLCYVALDYDAELQKAKSSSECDASYKLPNGKAITVSDVRFRCPEFLFKPQLNNSVFEGIHKTIFDSIMECNADVRNELFANIVLAGGLSMFEGLSERVEKEIKGLAPPETNVKVVAQPDRKYAAWIGGSRLACLDTFSQMAITRDEYDDVGKEIVNHKCLL